jgi:hypothetical protein
VYLPLASTDVTGEISLARVERGRFLCRSSDCLTAAASNAVPSLNLIPRLSAIVTVCLSADSFGIDAASCGTISSFRFRS